MSEKARKGVSSQTTHLPNYSNIIPVQPRSEGFSQSYPYREKYIYFIVEKSRGCLRVLHYQVGSSSVISSERMCKGQTLEKSAFQIFRGGNSAFISSSDELNFQVKLKGEKVCLKQFSPFCINDGLLV